jgi:hypothetical protein
MKKITVKKQLIDFMIANGNDFRYTDMIKATLRICRGKNYVYTRADRGFYGTNFCSAQGYMINGGGDCGVYKNENGRWSAKYYTREDKVNYIVNRQINILSNLVSKERNHYDYNMRENLSDYVRGTQYYADLLNSYMSKYRNNVESYKSDAKTKILKGILKIA